MRGRKPVGAILYREGKGGGSEAVYAVAKWRDSTGRQNYRRVGRAWMEADGDGGWRKRSGRAPEGYIDRRAAERAMDALIDETEQALLEVQPNRQATFAVRGCRVAGVGRAHETPQAGDAAQL